MKLRLVFIVFLGSSWAPTMVLAQRDASHDAWTAARNTLLGWRNPPDSVRIVADSATMYERFATCQRGTTPPTCALTGQAPVFLLTIRAVTADSVVAAYRVFTNAAGPCTSRGRGGGTVIASLSGGDFSMVRRNERWQAVGSGRGYAC